MLATSFQMGTAVKKLKLTPQKKGRGRPRKYENLLVEIIDKWFAGDRDKAAEAWGTSRHTIDKAISGSQALPSKLAIVIHLKTNKEIPLETLVELTSKSSL